MLVETEDLPEKPETPSPAHHSPIRVRSDLQEEYSADEIAKMTALYEGTLSNIEEGEIVKSKVLRVTDTAVILDVGFKMTSRMTAVSSWTSGSSRKARCRSTRTRRP